MKIFDLFTMSFRNLSRRKLRTILTVLGVLIGSSAIVVMLSLGISLQINTEKNLNEMGDINIIEIRPDRNIKKVITENDLNVIKKIPGIRAVMPLFEVRAKVISGRCQLVTGYIYGIDPEVSDEFGMDIKKGRALKDEDTLAVLYGNEALFVKTKDLHKRKRMIDSVDIDLQKAPIKFTFDTDYGEQNYCSNKKPTFYKLEFAGLLNKFNWEMNDYIFMNLPYLKKLKQSYDRRKLKGEITKGNTNIKLKKKQQFGYTEAKILAENYKEIPNLIEKIEEFDINAYSASETIQKAREQSAFTQAIFGGIGGVTLLISAIGIANTMIMSIYERTKEIGIMKVIGANIKDIKKIFLIEAGMIGFIGGLLSILLSYIISFLLNNYGVGFMDYYNNDIDISIIPIWLCPLALAFSTLVGVISGYYPAKRAVKLSALHAIKSD